MNEAAEDFLTEDVLMGTNWRATERSVARVMSHCGWADVQVVGGRGDSGGDVLGKFAGNGKVFVVQVKTVQGDRYVGPDSLDEAIRALHLYGGDVAVVATNGDFTLSAHRRVAELKRHGYECKLWNGVFLRELLSRRPSDHWQKRSLRPYQEKVLEASLSKYRSGGRAVQFVVATGLGKTTIAAEIINALSHDGLSKVLVLCHSIDLCRQLEQSFWYQLPKSVPTHVFYDGTPPKRFEGVSFGTYQTMIGYLPGFEPNAFDVVVVDEAHHALASGFLRCLNHLRPHLTVGMTATPWRGDGLNLSQVFGEPVATVSLVDGMKLGYLAKVSYRIYCDTVNWKDVAGKAGEKISVKDLNRRLFVPQRDEAIVQETVRVASEIHRPRVIFFCSSVEHGFRVAKLANQTGVFRCRPLSGVDRVERYKSLMEFSAGRINAVTAVDVVNEGIDVPDVNVIVFLRVTHSRRIFVQQLGRGLRLAPGKTEVVVLDFVTDLRRIADVLELDREARSPGGAETRNIYFPEGIVRFENRGAIPFVEQWLKDVADLENRQETTLLKFPPEV